MFTYFFGRRSTPCSDCAEVPEGSGEHFCTMNCGPCIPTTKETQTDAALGSKKHPPGPVLSAEDSRNRKRKDSARLRDRRTRRARKSETETGTQERTAKGMRDPIPVGNAYLCKDCERIGDDPHVCQCSSSHLLALGPILNREAAPTDARLRYLMTVLDVSLGEIDGQPGAI